MHRNNLLEKLNRYAQSYPQEHNTIERYREFVRAQPDCFKRSLLAGHVTGSAWVVNLAGTHVLLTHHAKLNQWFQLGGHADGDSDTLAVALKEAREESGIMAIAACSEALFDIDIHEIPARGSEPLHYHYDTRYAFQVQQSEQFSVSKESNALAWVPINAIGEKTTEASMLRMAAKWPPFAATVS